LRLPGGALVHDALYSSQELDNIDIATYIQGLTHDLKSAFKQSKLPIRILTEVDQINLSVDMAVPCGLLINELVTNALKYAFPDPNQKDKQILVRFTLLDTDNVQLEISDNGTGIQKPVVWDSVHSLGLYLVKILSEHQLMGSVILNNGENVSPEEIEQHYSKSNFIKEICVFGFPMDSPIGLSALIVPDMEHFRRVKELRISDKLRWEIDSLSRDLPAFKRIKDVRRYERAFKIKGPGTEGGRDTWRTEP